MTIGLVLPNIPAYSETFFRNKILGLQQNGITVILFVNSHQAEKTYLGCKVEHAPCLQGHKLYLLGTVLLLFLKALGKTPIKSYKLYLLNAKDGISIITNLKRIVANQFLLKHALDWLHFGFGTMAMGRENVAQAIGAKMAVSFRGFDIAIYPLKHPKCYELLYKKVNKIHVISDDLTQLLYKDGCPKDKQIVKITPAIHTDYFISKTLSQNAVLQLMTVARLHWKKGLESTLEALALLKQEGITFEYTIIGEGVEKERLLYAVHQLGLTENVIFTGKLPHEAVRTHLETADIYLQYSIQEGFCNAVLEAQAMGTLCIVSNAEGLSENVIDNVTGWVVPKLQPKLLATKLIDVIKLDKTHKVQIRKTAIERVRKEFNLELQRVAFYDFFKS